MDDRTRRRGRRRRSRRPADSAARPAAAVPAPAAAPPAGPQAPAARRPAAAEPTAAEAGAGEQAWERTHLEQTMFALAREHAEAAARCARQTPPDPQGEQTHSLMAVLMSFLALEAFINMAGTDRLGPRFRYYDRMPPEGKWSEVTRLVSKTGKTFADEGPEMTALSTLRTWRNLLTHYKGEYEEVPQAGGGGTRVEALLSAENAARAVESALILYRAFYEFDRRSPPRQFIWLDDRPHAMRRAAGQSPAPGPASPPPRSAAGAPARPRRRRRRH